MKQTWETERGREIHEVRKSELFWGRKNSRTHIFCRQEGRCLGEHHDIEVQMSDRNEKQRQSFASSNSNWWSWGRLWGRNLQVSRAFVFLFGSRILALRPFVAKLKAPNQNAILRHEMFYVASASAAARGFCCAYRFNNYSFLLWRLAFVLVLCVSLSFLTDLFCTDIIALPACSQTQRCVARESHWKTLCRLLTRSVLRWHYDRRSCADDTYHFSFIK